MRARPADQSLQQTLAQGPANLQTAYTTHVFVEVNPRVRPGTVPAVQRSARPFLISNFNFVAPHMGIRKWQKVQTC